MSNEIDNCCNLHSKIVLVRVSSSTSISQFTCVNTVKEIC